MLVIVASNNFSHKVRNWHRLPWSWLTLHSCEEFPSENICRSSVNCWSWTKSQKTIFCILCINLARFHFRHCSCCQNLNCHHIECLCVEDDYNRKDEQGSTKCCLMHLRPLVMGGSLHSHPPVKFAYFDIFLCNSGERDEVRRAVLWDAKSYRSTWGCERKVQDSYLAQNWYYFLLERISLKSGGVKGGGPWTDFSSWPRVLQWRVFVLHWPRAEQNVQNCATNRTFNM